MAFFAVMLPDAFKDPASIKKELVDSFKEMSSDEVKDQQKNVVKLGQMIRDAIVAESIAKGNKPPPASTSTASSSSSTTTSSIKSTPAAPAPVPTVAPKPSEPSDADLEAMLPAVGTAIKKKEIEKAYDKLKQYFKDKTTPSRSATGPSMSDAWSTSIEPYRDSKTDFPDRTEVKNKLKEAWGKLKGGSRMRTPRKTGRRHSYKQKPRH